ncbi:MAG TPA: permease prefix domain 1-containing protein [Streptosporangiaceae bacterium]|nr:permease prefix domain 1-containing protein [Streptosporangiaceae bacterium]
MADHGLIAAYRQDLLAQLPADLADEVTDGLTDAHERYLLRGLRPDQAAAAAIAEFGEPGTVAAAFRRACPVWRLARVLIATGPIVGGSWAAALVTARVWDWPVPIAARLVVGLVLAASVVMLATASLTHRYPSLVRAGIAGSLGIAALDVAVVTTAVLLGPDLRWLVVVAVCVSMARLTFVARTLCRYLARHAY